MKITIFKILTLILIINFLLISCTDNSNTNIVIKLYSGQALCPKWAYYIERIVFISPGFYDEEDIPPFGDAIFIMDNNGSSVEEIAINNHNLAIDTISVSNKNDYISFSAREKLVSNRWDIYIVPINGGKPIKLTNDKEIYSSYSPTWSPEDDWIYFLRSDGYDNCSIWRVRPDGGDISKLNIEVKYRLYSIECSNSGDYFLVSFLDENSHHAIMMLSIDGSEKWLVVGETILYGSKEHPCLSPDDKWVCFRYGYELWIASTRGDDEPYKITDYGSDYGPYGDTSPDWSGDGNWIVFQSQRNDGDGLYKVKVPDEFLP